MPLTHETLQHALRQAICHPAFTQIKDYEQNNGQPLQDPPSLDLAVIAFPDNAPPVYANVLSWRGCPQGHGAEINPDTLEVEGICWQKDARDEQHNSYLWHKGAQWDTVHLENLLPDTSGRPFVIPYPASLLKLMVAVKIMELVDKGQIDLETLYPDATGTSQSVAQWLDEMITVSSNKATFALYRLLHAQGEIQSTIPPDQSHLPYAAQTQRHEKVNRLNELFYNLGLRTLQSNQTRPSDGSFFNRDGSGVGAHHMTAWDTARLLWLLDTAAPTPTWQVEGQPVKANFMSAAAKDYLVQQLLGQQALHEVLSSTIFAGSPHHVTGIPALVPPRWLNEQGYFTVADYPHDTDLRPLNAQAEVMFAHKTGLTGNYSSNAGIVRGLPGKAQRHYIIAFISNLGSRYAPISGPHVPTAIAYMAAEIDNFLKVHLDKSYTEPHPNPPL